MTRFTVGWILLVTATFAQADDAVERLRSALSRKDGTPGVSKLEQLAGGRSQLIEGLSQLRGDRSSLPFIAIRAQKLLVGFSSNASVGSLLKRDIVEGEVGLARVLMLHIDRILDPELRREIAERGVSRAERDFGFVRAARALLSSTDPEVRAIASKLARNS